jgi:hypothetical protein
MLRQFVVFGLLAPLATGCDPDGDPGSSDAPWLPTRQNEARADETTKRVSMAIEGMT